MSTNRNGEIGTTTGFTDAVTQWTNAGYVFTRTLPRREVAIATDAESQTRTVLQLSGNAVQRGKSYVLRAWFKTQDIAGEAAIGLQPHEAPLFIGFQEFGFDFINQTVILCQADHIIDAIALTPAKNLITTETRICSDQNVYGRPLLPDLGDDPFQFLFREHGHEVPANLERPLKAPVLIPLRDELLLELVCEFQVLLVQFRQCLLADDGDQPPEVSAIGVGGIKLISHVPVVLPRFSQADAEVHKP